MHIIKPKTMPGTMELLPPEQIAFNRMLNTIRTTFERYGFLPIDTPAIEMVDILLTKSGGDTEKQVYFVQSTGSLQKQQKPKLALRFDLTVPLARYVAQYENDLSMPFRRYQIQKVYRGESAQKGRYREFYQCDIDVIGKDKLSIDFDAEIPAVIYDLFSQLNIGKFTIHINNRKLLLGFLESLAIEEENRPLLLREIDKIDKKGKEEVLKSLVELFSLSDATIATMDRFISLSGTNQEVLAELANFAADNATYRSGLQEITTVVELLGDLQVPEEFYKVNPAMARGLDYYTGSIYETLLDDHKGIGSICSGGRYENLAGHYTKSKLPGVGISIGATRLFYQLQNAGLLGNVKSTIEVLVTQMDEKLKGHYFKVAGRLRKAGINTEVYIQKAKFAKQMKYASNAGIPFAIIVGSQELEKNVVQLKDLNAGEQHEISLDGLVEKILELRK